MFFLNLKLPHILKVKDVGHPLDHRTVLSVGNQARNVTNQLQSGLHIASIGFGIGCNYIIRGESDKCINCSLSQTVKHGTVVAWVIIQYQCQQLSCHYNRSPWVRDSANYRSWENNFNVNQDTKNITMFDLFIPCAQALTFVYNHIGLLYKFICLVIGRTQNLILIIARVYSGNMSFLQLFDRSTHCVLRKCDSGIVFPSSHLK